MRPITVSRAETFAIGELSRFTGVNIETIRYYERIKMMPAPPRTASGRRIYGPAETRSLAFIRRSRARLHPRGNSPCWVGVGEKSEEQPHALQKILQKII